MVHFYFFLSTLLFDYNTTVGVYGASVPLIAECSAVLSVTITILCYDLENYELLTSCFNDD